MFVKENIFFWITRKEDNILCNFVCCKGKCGVTFLKPRFPWQLAILLWSGENCKQGLTWLNCCSKQRPLVRLLTSTQPAMSQYLTVNILQGVFIVKGGFGHYRFVDLNITRLCITKIWINRKVKLSKYPKPTTSDHCASK